jgi:hypothetical protein
MRKIVLVLLLVSIFPLPKETAAKGMSDRIVISSEALSEDIIVEDERMLSALYLMANFEEGEIAEPEDIDVGYELKRQTMHDGQYTGFDVVHYHPNTSDGSGYVYYLDVVYGTSTLAKKWYHVSPEAELAMQYIVGGQHLTDYIIASELTGQFRLLDPVTLETVHTLDVGSTAWLDMTNSNFSLDGNRLFFERNVFKRVEHFYIDLNSREVCSTGNHRFISPSIDGQHLIFQAGDAIEKRDAQTFELVASINELFTDDGQHHMKLFVGSSLVDAIGIIWDDTTQSGEMFWLDMLTFEIVDRIALDFTSSPSSAALDTTFGELFVSDGQEWAKWYVWNDALDFARPVRPINGQKETSIDEVPLELVGMQRGKPIYYPRFSRDTLADSTDIAGGIIVSGLRYGKQEITLFQPDILFQHVIIQGNYLYGIEAPGDGNTTTIYRLDINSGDILNSVATTADVHRLDFARLDTTNLHENQIKTSPCSIELSLAAAH